MVDDMLAKVFKNPIDEKFNGQVMDAINNMPLET